VNESCVSLPLLARFGFGGMRRDAGEFCLQFTIPAFSELESKKVSRVKWEFGV
jgi:hypothetical protein